MEKDNKINYKNIAIIFLIGFVILVLNFSGNPKQTIDSFKNVDWFWLMFAVFLYFVTWFFEMYVVHVLIRDMVKKNHKLTESLKLSIIGKLFDNITAFGTGGQPFQVWRMHKKSGIPISKGTSILVFKSMIYQLVVLVMYLVVMLLNFKTLVNYQYVFVLIVIGFLINVGVGVMVISAALCPKAVKKIINLILSLIKKIKILQKLNFDQQKAIDGVDEFHDSFKQISKNKIVVIKTIFLSSCGVLVTHILPFYVFLSLGVKGSFSQSFVASNYTWLLSALVPLPGASMGSEGSFFITFKRVFADLVPTAMIIWRFITYYMPVIVSLALFVMIVKQEEKHK